MVNHCSSDGATVGIKSYISSRLKFQFKTKTSKPKSISVQFQIKLYFKVFSIHFKNQNKMSENIELSYVWDHTILKIFNHDIQSKMGNMIEECSLSWKISIHCLNTLMTISHQLENYVISIKMVESCIESLRRNFSTLDGIFNILLMNMNIFMVIMSGPIVYMKAIGPTEQTSNS